MSKVSSLKITKTYKREVAVGALCLLFYIAIGTKDVEMVKVLAWPTFTFAGLAYGLDWNGKRLLGQSSS